MYEPLYIVVLTGGIASGKSRVSRQLASLGAQVLDLDELSRYVLDTDEQLKQVLAQTFGTDVLDKKSGRVDRALLAQRAFKSAASTALLEKLELPAIKHELLLRLAAAQKRAVAGNAQSHTVGVNAVSAPKAERICVIEVPLPDRVPEWLDLADEVVLIDAPIELRCKRAGERGMTEADFWARASKQASDQWLRAHADTIVDNSLDEDALAGAIALWWKERVHGVS